MPTHPPWGWDDSLFYHLLSGLKAVACNALARGIELIVGVRVSQNGVGEALFLFFYTVIITCIFSNIHSDKHSVRSRVYSGY